MLRIYKIAESPDDLLRTAYMQKWQELQSRLEEIRSRHLQADEMLEETIQERKRFISWLVFQFNYIKDEKFAMVWSSVRRQHEKKLKEEERQLGEVEQENHNG